MTLRAVIFGLDGVLIKEGDSDLPAHLITQLRQLFDFLRTNDVEPIILANRDWIVKDDKTNTSRPIDYLLQERYGEHHLYVTTRLHLPPKPKRAAVDAILKRHNLSNEEAIYIGNSFMDFRTAINSHLLFLNVTWEREEVSYGFTFSSPKEVGRFIDVVGLKEHHWFYEIDCRTLGFEA